jgi:hypothetical protein
MYKMKQLKNIGGGIRIMDNYGITPLSTIFKLYCGSQFYRWGLTVLVYIDNLYVTN